MDISGLKNDRGLWAILDLCDPSLMVTALGLEAGLAGNDLVVADAMNTLLITGGQHASGLVLDPSWGLNAYTDWVSQSSLPQPPGLVLRLDTPPEPDATSTVPVLAPDWGIEQITNNYGIAFLELHYHPNEAEALPKKQVVGELYDFCQQQGTQLLLKLIIVSSDGVEAAPDVQLTAIQELRATTHMLALEVPSDPLATATLTAELDIPWLATPGLHQGFPQYQERVAQAMENGAQGYLVGDTAWADISQIKRPDQAADINQVKLFINTTFRERLETLNSILAEAGRV